MGKDSFALGNIHPDAIQTARSFTFWETAPAHGFRTEKARIYLPGHTPILTPTHSLH
jgi:hypothetical protein